MLPAPGPDFAAQAEAAAQAYAERYRAYFERNNAKIEPKKTMLDVQPRVVLVPGVGLFGAGASKKDAGVAADIYETNIKVIGAAEGVGRFESIGEFDIFEMEYWSLEQAKLGKAKEKPLARKIVAVTGAGSGIGAAVARAFAAEGAEVACLDVDPEAAARTAKAVKGLAVACDVTDDASVAAAIGRVVEAYGGLDILASNAGAAWSGKIGEVSAGLMLSNRLMASAALTTAMVVSAMSAAMAASLLERPTPNRPRPGTSTTRGCTSSMVFFGSIRALLRSK